MKFCVIGSGSGGRAFAAYLSSKGYPVHLYNRSLERIKYIKKKNKIKVKGTLKGSYKVDSVTQDLKFVINHANIILIVIPANAHREIAQKISPYLKKDQIILLNPGRTFGALEFRRIIDRLRPDIDVFIGETQTLLFTARALNKNKVQILKIKNSLNFTAFPENHTFFIYDTLKDVFPQLNAKKDYLQETLHNIGMLLHPTITLFNTGCLDNGKMFKYYKEGATRQICKVIEQLQFEINMIFQYLSIEPINFCQWAQQSYGVKGNNIYHTIQRIESYSEISSPQSLITRYFTEDIPTGLVPISSLAKSLDIETPTIDSIIQLSSVICNRNFFKEGRTIDKLNLNMFIQKRLKEIYPNIYSQYKILDKNKVI